MSLFMKSKQPDVDLLAMAEQLQPSAGGRGRRSPLYRWMFKRAVAFDQMLSELQPSWGSVAEALKQRDVKDGTGKHPTAECARKTWFEVRRANGWLAKPQTSDVPVPQKPAQARLNVSATPGPDRTPSQSKVPAPIRVSLGRPSRSPEPLPSIPQDEDDPLAAIRREMNQRSGRNG